ncbi:uncharacterized protein PV09_02197 [Verruconis gallopava]|uniref:Translin-associated protein X n=1 Tax=Verruconis gallopava TaxID=253628 RepID=A0A0D1XX24_9PEZI|nr:uncharacterized protein PV09_02197 [Verruconis gallopava]KIW07351.1 hypothetical protein PV09_02197 [Verruconis gallopava]
MHRGKGKRTAEAAFDDGEANPQSPFLSMFESLRDELDEHHDRRERIIKASRDITAASKKIIFSLQRVRQVGCAVPKELQQPKQWETIRNSYDAIAADLQDINAHRYSHNITGGNQELMEAISFQHYLETQRLITIEESREKLAAMSSGKHKVMLTESDYVLGICDMVGELMRFAITAMATGGQIAPAASKVNDDDMDTDLPEPRSVLSDMRELRGYLELLDAGGSSLAKDFGKKMPTMQECVEKVEKASYGQVVRGSERPKGWIPDLDDKREELEAV